MEREVIKGHPPRLFDSVQPLKNPMVDVLRQNTRQKAGKGSLRIVLIDSQSVKSGNTKASKGFDDHKKSKGRKRHFIFDSGGRLIRVMTTKANRHDKGCAALLIKKMGLSRILPNPQEVHADKA